MVEKTAGKVIERRSMGRAGARGYPADETDRGGPVRLAGPKKKNHLLGIPVWQSLSIVVK
jgi:hypothetical protein